ncbi:MAG: FAD-dependent oxidoreductase [Caldilineaceae bacterium]
MYDIAVIGPGMIGAAAAHYLAEDGLNVVAIGPAEPDNWRDHRGVWSSHYDQGRITRIIDADPIWTAWAARSINAYADLEQRSGVLFHAAVGGLQLVHAPGDGEDRQRHRIENGHRFGAVFTEMDGDTLRRDFPFLHFPDDFVGVWETGQAGYVNPRSLVRAQLIAMQQAGGELLRETAVHVREDGDAMAVTTDGGRTVLARKVLVAAGSFANNHNLLLGRRLSMTVKKRTVTLAEVDEAERARLATMPTVITPVLGIDNLPSIYVLPPVQYPDGKWYIKLGGTNLPEELGTDLAEFDDWFHADGSAQEADALRQALLDLIPGLAARNFVRKACVLTYTDHGYPYVDAVVPGKLYTAVGGCGSAAKSSNEIGRMAALLAANDAWTYDIDAANFRAIYQRDDGMMR